MKQLVRLFLIDADRARCVSKAVWRAGAYIRITRGKESAPKGVMGVLDMAFTAPPVGLGLHRGAGKCHSDQMGSVRVARKAGFRMEGLGGII